MLKLLAILLALAILGQTGCLPRRNRAWKGGRIIVWDIPRAGLGVQGDLRRTRELIAGFERRHPGVAVDLIETSWGELPARLNAAISADVSPDIAPVDTSGGGLRITYLEKGLVEPLEGTLTPAELEDLLPAAREAFTYRGHLYGFPSSSTVQVLLLNLDLFRRRGVEPPAGGKWTWEEFRSTARKLTFERKFEDGRTQLVYGFAGAVKPGFYELWPFLYMDGARPLNPEATRFTFDAPGALSALSRLADLKLADKAVDPLTGSDQTGELFSAFSSPGKRTVAIEPWGSWAVNALLGDAAYTETPLDFAVAEYPTGAARKPATLASFTGYLVFKQKDPEKRKLVQELARELASPEEQYAAAATFGALPARRSVLARDPFARQPLLARTARMLELAESLPRHPEWARIDSAIQSQLQLVFDGNKKPAEAMADARKDVDAILEGK